MEILNTLYQYLHLSSPMVPLSNLDIILSVVKIFISCMGTLVILLGILIGAYRFLILRFLPKGKKLVDETGVDFIRRDLGRTIVLGLEFIIAADVIETTTTPTYYSVGILAIIVIIRTFLSFTLNREISQLTPSKRDKLQD